MVRLRAWGGCLTATLICGMALFPAAPALAGSPRVEFDLGYTAECRDVTTPEFAATHPAERIIEARFRISTLVSSGHERDLEELFITAQSTERRLRVHDFTPHNLLQSEFAEPICTTETDELTTSFDTGVGGTATAPVTFGTVTATPSTGARISKRNATTETTKRLPPQDLVLAAGTLDGEHGVFFKLKQNSQSAFEGAKEFFIRFIVPSDWRADWLVLTCEARGPNHWYKSKGHEISGQAKVLVSLHLEGDEAARQAARRMAAAQAAVFDHVRQAGRKPWEVDIERIVAATAVLSPPKPKPFVVTDLVGDVGQALGLAKDRPENDRPRQASTSPDAILRRAANNVARLSAMEGAMATARR
jgi:hypothetical protein